MYDATSAGRRPALLKRRRSFYIAVQGKGRLPGFAIVLLLVALVVDSVVALLLVIDGHPVGVVAIGFGYFALAIVLAIQSYFAHRGIGPYGVGHNVQVTVVIILLFLIFVLPFALLLLRV